MQALFEPRIPQGPSPFQPQTSSVAISLQHENYCFHSQKCVIIFAPATSAHVKIDHRKFDLHRAQFLLVNSGREVEILPSAEGPGVLVVMLDMAQADARRKAALTTLGATRTYAKMELCEQVYDAEESCLGRALLKVTGVHATHSEAQESWEELLWKQQAEVFEELQRLTSAKLSTRKELYLRLCEAKRYMLDHLDEHLNLDTLAQVACLSKYHFIRLFKEVYDQTPRQYLIALRLERASELLTESSMSFHDICHEVGLKDSSSFGRLFKRSFGATPHTYRRMKAQL